MAIFVENGAKTLFVESQPQTVFLGKLGDDCFATIDRGRPEPGQIRFVNRAMICRFQFFNNPTREYFHTGLPNLWSFVLAEKRFSKLRSLSSAGERPEH